MRTLLEKIKLDAETRLTLPSNTSPSRETARYRKYLKLETHRLKMWHRGGAAGRMVCFGRAAVLDLLFCQILRALERSANGSAPPGNYALVAIGGYGRAELNPFSDIDIMFLYEGRGLSRERPPAFMELLTGGLLWDIGLRVGHSVRNLDDCVKVANSDMQSKTSLIEARLICGSEALFRRLQEAVVAKCVKGHEDEYIAARLEDQAGRRAKFGNSACMQEPHIKNGCGGLRDYQNLLWMAFFKHRSRTLGELQAGGMISPQEGKQLEAAYDFLLRVRNELHYHVDRAVDVLSKSVQPAVAHHLGYTDRSPSRRIERFMGDYYNHSRHIYLITRTVEQRLALLPQPKRLPSLRHFLRQRRQLASYAIDGFKFVDGQILAASEGLFQQEPRRLMRAFRHAQQRELELNPDLAQLIRNQLELVNLDFQRDPHVHETFLEILNQRGNVGRILRAMHEVGLLGRYLPAFGKLTCLVQHEFYHQYTADEHTLVCLEKLDQIWGAKQGPQAQYAEIFQKIERPLLLHLALLLHDAGKATPAPDHAEASSRIALSVGKRLGLDHASTHTLGLLTRHHLVMIQISQRRDLDDPGEVRNFAALIENQEQLNLLTLLTFADSLGTSDQLWNGFKDTLLWTLHHKTHNVLSGGTEFIRAEAKHRDTLAHDVRALLPPTFREDEFEGHFAKLPPRYFQLRTAKEILTDLELAHLFMHRQLSDDENPLEPVIDWFHDTDRGYSLVKVCTWDRHGLFSKIAGALTAAGLNILSAQIFTRDDNIVLDTFFVTDALTGLLVNREERERFERLLKEALTGDLDLGALINRRKVAPPPYLSHEGEHMPTVVRFDNTTSETRTVLDVETEDRVGLLYAISQVLSQMALDVSLAKICTEKGAAMDSFYVSEFDGKKVLRPERQRLVEASLRAVIKKLS